MLSSVVSVMALAPLAVLGASQSLLQSSNPQPNYLTYREITPGVKTALLTQTKTDAKTVAIDSKKFLQVETDTSPAPVSLTKNDTGPGGNLFEVIIGGKAPSAAFGFTSDGKLSVSATGFKNFVYCDEPGAGRKLYWTTGLKVVPIGCSVTTFKQTAA